METDHGAAQPAGTPGHGPALLEPASAVLAVDEIPMQTPLSPTCHYHSVGLIHTLKCSWREMTPFRPQPPSFSAMAPSSPE